MKTGSSTSAKFQESPSLSLSDTTQAKLVVVGPWRPAACLPSVMSTFGEILAHLGTVIMGVQGVRHIGHIGTAGYNQLGRPPYPQT